MEQPERNEDVLARYLDNELAPDEQRELAALLAGVPELAERLEMLLQVDDLLDQALHEERTHEAFLAALKARVARRSSEDSRQVASAVKEALIKTGRRRPGSIRAPERRSRSGTLWPYLGVAAAVLVVLGIAWLTSQRPAAAPEIARRRATGALSAVSSTGADRSAEAPAAATGSTQTTVQRAGTSAETSSQLRQPPEVASISDAVEIPPIPAPKISGTPPTLPQTQSPTAAQGAGQPTERAIARVAMIRGLVMFARGDEGKWMRAVEGIRLLTGDRLDTRTGRARLELEAARIYANRGTVLRLARTPPGEEGTLRVRLSRGEVYVEDEGQQVAVETTDGLFSPVGTRFDVRKVAASIVTVEEGTVDVRAKAPPAAGGRRFTWVGRALRIAAGHRSVVRRGTVPSAPVKTEPGRSVAWTSGLRRRVRSDLLALYTFQERSGATVRDHSGVGRPLELHIRDRAAVRWLPKGGLRVVSPTLIASAAPATKILQGCLASNAITIEAWVRTAYPMLRGPARIVTLSRDSNRTNFTLGMNGSRWEQAARNYTARLRTTVTSQFGTLTGTRFFPVLATGAGTARKNHLTHVVFTRDAGGRTHFFLDGVEKARGAVQGEFTNWDQSLRLSLAYEIGLTSDEKHWLWLGEYRLVAIFSRALTGAEVRQNFVAGPPVRR